MRTLPTILALVALTGCTELPVCPLVDERRIGADDVGPDGFSANDLLAVVGSERAFSVAPNRKNRNERVGVKFNDVFEAVQQRIILAEEGEVGGHRCGGIPRPAQSSGQKEIGRGALRPGKSGVIPMSGQAESGEE